MEPNLTNTINRTEFTNNSSVHSEANGLRHPPWLIGLYAIAYISIFLIGLFANLLVITVIRCNKNLQSVTNFYIVNLAIADLLVICWCLPPTLVSHIFIPWKFGWLGCKTVAYVQGVSVIASVYSLVAISVDRFLAIWRPLRLKGGRRSARCAAVMIWIFSASLMIPWLMYFQTVKDEYHPDTEFCTDIWPNTFIQNTFFVVVNVILGYLVPLTIIMICYLCIWFRVWKRYVPNDPATGSFTRAQSSHVELVHQRAKVSVLRMVIIIVLVFALSWLPLYTIFTWIKFQDHFSELEIKIITYLVPGFQWLGSSSSAINPVLYAIINKKFRRTLYAKIDRIRINNSSSGSNNKKIGNVLLENKPFGLNGSGGVKNEPVDLDTYV